MTDLEARLREITEGAGARRLDDRVLSIEGDDARTWLNGQVTNDVRSTAAGDSVYALVVNTKGRIQTDLWVQDRGDGAFYLLVPAATEEAMRERFESYVIMEDVEITARPDLAIVTVQGPRSSEVARAVGERVFAADRLGYGGFDLLVPIEGVEATLQRLRDAGASDVLEATWEVARVLANRPRFAVDFDGSSYPQEALLEARAVSFQKGCYVGQEVVHMLQVRGQASRRLVPLHLDALVEPGQELMSPEGKPVGRVTSVIEAPDRSVRALGYVKRAHAEAETVLRAGSATARVLG